MSNHKEIDDHNGIGEMERFEMWMNFFKKNSLAQFFKIRIMNFVENMEEACIRGEWILLKTGKKLGLTRLKIRLVQNSKVELKNYCKIANDWRIYWFLSFYEMTFNWLTIVEIT